MKTIISKSGDKIFTPRMFRQFVCGKDSGHVEPYRGEVNLVNGHNKPWKRCPYCDGIMVVRSFRLTADNQIIPNVRAEGPKPEKKARKSATAKQLIDRILKNKHISGRFTVTRVGLGHAVCRMHNDITWSPRNGGVKRDDDTTRCKREVELYADPASQSVAITLYGCPGWGEWFKEAARKSHINPIIDFKHPKTYAVGQQPVVKADKVPAKKTAKK